MKFHDEQSTLGVYENYLSKVKALQSAQSLRKFIIEATACIQNELMNFNFSKELNKLLKNLKKSALSTSSIYEIEIKQNSNFMTI